MKIDYKQLEEVVANAAPIIGTALGGPLGSVAGSLIASAFGGDAQDPKDLVTRIKADPAAEFKLRELEMTHKENLLSLANQAYTTEVDDRKDARQRELQIVKAIGREDPLARNLAYIITVGFFVTIFLLFTRWIDLNDTEKTMLGMLLGVLSTKFGTVYDFVFGSSAQARKLNN